MSQTEGYYPIDLKSVIDKARIIAFQQMPLSNNDLLLKDSAVMNGISVSFENLKEAMKDYSPINLKGVKRIESAVNWHDVGGTDNLENLFSLHIF